MVSSGKHFGELALAASQQYRRLFSNFHLHSNNASLCVRGSPLSVPDYESIGRIPYAARVLQPIPILQDASR